MTERRHWQTEGQDPDYRFSLANERTFLAWIRTALALIAGGVVLHEFAPHALHRAVAEIAAIVFSVSGAVLPVFAYWRWKSHEIAMRHSRSLGSTGPSLSAVSIIVCIAAGALSILLLRSGS